MHPNASYREQPEQEVIALADRRGFGVLTAKLQTLFGVHVLFVVHEKSLPPSPAG